MLVVVITCTISAILGLSMVTKGGKDMLDLIIEANTSWNILLIALVEVLFVAWVYGADRFWNNIEEMGMKRRPCIKKYANTNCATLSSVELSKYLWSHVVVSSNLGHCN